MAPVKIIASEADRVIAQTHSTCIALSTIGDEIRHVLDEDRHDPGLAATVVAAHAKRAALAITTIASLAGQLELLARMGGGLILLLLLVLTGCGAPSDGGPRGTPQIDAANCVTTIEAEPADCDSAHTLVMHCGAASGVGEAQPSELCLAGPGAFGMVWCCVPAFAEACLDEGLCR